MTEENHIAETYLNDPRTPTADEAESLLTPSVPSVGPPSGDPSAIASRHGIHHPSKSHFSLWMDTVLLARFRRRAKEVGISASDLFVRVLGPLEHVTLLPEDYEWIERRKKQGENRKY